MVRSSPGAFIVCGWLVGQVEEHAIEVHDAFGMAQAERGMLQLMGSSSNKNNKNNKADRDSGVRGVSASASRLLNSFVV